MTGKRNLENDGEYGVRHLHPVVRHLGAGAEDEEGGGVGGNQGQLGGRAVLRHGE